MTSSRKLRESPLLGTWKLRSYSVTTAGVRSTPYGESPTGYISYSADGRMQVIGAASGRRRPAGPTATTDELVALHQTMFAYAGTYAIEGDKIIHRVDVSWNETWTGTDQTRLFELRGNTLTLEMCLTDPVGGTETRYSAVWDKLPNPESSHDS